MRWIVFFAAPPSPVVQERLPPRTTQSSRRRRRWAATAFSTSRPMDWNVACTAIVVALLSRVYLLLFAPGTLLADPSVCGAVLLLFRQDEAGRLRFRQALP
ncbi:hypothetical protein RRG08_023755 [Elysia crispata]|uniref:Uncharacterized protein n=1 Tax=Elysia crispata TaxID=231223 RepID=A0AAE1DN21_9GAST|nr:hypothetical protein RRG08_023755 [Elysia crispata]